MGWQIIILITGSIFSIFSLVLQKEEGEKDKENLKIWLKRISIILIFVGATAACIDTFNKHASETKNANNLENTLKNSDSTLTKIIRAAHTLDSIHFIGFTTIDSLKNLQKNAELIIGSMQSQLELQHVLNTTSESIYEKSQDLLTQQKDIALSTNRLLHPFFPATFGISFEVSFSDKQIEPLVQYVLELKSRLETEKIPDLVNGKYGSAWYPIQSYYPGLGNLPFNYAYITDSALRLDKLIPLDFNIAIVDGQVTGIRAKDKKLPQFNFSVGRQYNNKEPDVTLNVNYREKIIEFRVHYTDYNLIRSPQYESNTIFGTDELKNKYIAITCFPSDSFQPKITRIWFVADEGHEQPLTINFTEANSFIGLYSFNGKTYYHKIAKEDVRTFDDYWN